MRSTGAGNSGAVIGAGPAGIPQQTEPQAITYEEQVIMIEANRIRDKERVESGDLPPYPPTDFTEIIEQENQANQSPL